MSEKETAHAERDAQIFFSKFSEAAASVLGKITGKTFYVKPLAAQEEQSTREEADLILLGAADGGLRGEFLLHLQPTSLQVLGQTLLGEPPDTSVAMRPDFREATEELMRQIAGAFATGLTGIFGETQLRLASAVSPTWPSAAQACLTAAADGFPETKLVMNLSSALLASLRRPVQGSPLDYAYSGRNLDSFMNVQLALTLRFGARQMLLREILELNAGAVVELDRKVQAPVDLLLDGRVIGCGEVVVVDGNYGLRVTELSSGAKFAE